MDVHIFDYYLTLLQVQMVILGFVVAGLVTMMQLLNTAIPKRGLRMLAHPAELVSYVLLLSGLVVVMGLATWVMAFGHPTSILVGFFSDRLAAILLLVLSLGSLLWFVFLVYRTKRLLDPRLYLSHYIDSVSSTNIRSYVTSVYSDNVDIANIYDPFQPIREYIKHNAREQYDYGTAAGLKLFGRLFNKAFRSISSETKKEYPNLAKYFADSSVDFFLVFHKVASEKRKLDVIQHLHAKGKMFLEVDDHECLLIMVKALEEIGSLSQDEDEIVEVIERVKDLTDAYLARHEKAPWDETATEFEEICLAMTRLAERYYLQKDTPLRSITPISYYTGKTKNVSISLVDFLTAYKNLADLRIEAQPKLYFESIEAIAEVLFSQIRIVQDSGKAAIGLNSQHHQLTTRLYDIYYNFALEAIEHNRADLFALSIGNLRRVIKSANQFGLDDERATITKIIIELTLRALVSMGDATIKGERTISAYAIETLHKHANQEDITDTLSTLSDATDIDFSNEAVIRLKENLSHKK